MSAESSTPLSRDRVLDLLRAIDDPEMPINIVDLGIVHNVALTGADENPPRDRPLAPPDVTIDIIPTFVGCPALDMIRDRIAGRLRAAGAAGVTVRFVHDPPWSVDRITAAGREALRRHGITVPTPPAGGSCGHPRPDFPEPRLVPLNLPHRDAPPAARSPHRDAPPPPAARCPLCGGDDTQMESPFGPARCRMIYYCRACRSQFELLRRV